MAVYWFLYRRTFVWRYFTVTLFVVYVLSCIVFIPHLLSSSSTRQDLFETVWDAESEVATSNQSAAAADRRPIEAAVDEIMSTKPSMKLKMIELLDNLMPQYKVVNPHPFQYVINSPNICRNQDVYIVAYIHTAPHHYKRRVVIRQTWGDVSQYDVSIRVVFFMGIAAAGTDGAVGKQHAVEFESTQYGDIVQENFVDAYHNLTYKGVAALRWITRYCSHARYVLKTDDDIFVNTFNLLRHVRRLERGGGTALAPSSNVTDGSPAPRGLLLCLVWKGMPVMREGKWKTSKEEWSSNMFPTYCSGCAFLMSTDVAVAMHRISYYVPFFWVDDVYVTGLLPQRLGPTVVQHTDLRSVYLLEGYRLVELFTGPQWYQYVYSHVSNLNAIQAVWRAVVRLSSGYAQPHIPVVLPGHLPKLTDNVTLGQL